MISYHTTLRHRQRRIARQAAVILLVLLLGLGILQSNLFIPECRFPLSPAWLEAGSALVAW